MHSHDTTPPRVHFLRAVAVIVLLLLFVEATKAQAPFTVRCGEDVHSAMTAAGNPQTVTFEGGCTYRLSRRIDPANGQTFIGNGATLSGARVLTGWQPEGGRWYVADQKQQGRVKTVDGETMCEASAPRCNFPELLFRDGQPLTHGGELGAGDWFFDYERDRIYVYADPAGRLIETAVTNCAICGAANDVTVRNFSVQGFATPTENAAIEGYNPGGKGWTIEGNTITLNSAIGAVVRTNGVLRGNTLNRNGQAGYGAGGSQSVKATGIVIEDNEIAENNFKRVNPFFSSGGGKASWTVGLIFRGNDVHSNYKRGIWFDLDNSETVIENNRVERNDTGLFLEMGGSAVVRGNAFRCNGTGTDGTFQTSILITNASNILIEGNTITVCAEGNAIGIREDGNPDRTINDRRRETAEIDIRGNTITFLAGRGAVGQDAYNGGQLGRVTWANNVYDVRSATYEHWLVEGVKLSFADWKRRYPSETLATVDPIPQPSATPPVFGTLTPVPATMTPPPVETPTAPALTLKWRIVIDVYEVR